MNMHFKTRLVGFEIKEPMRTTVTPKATVERKGRREKIDRALRIINAMHGETLKRLAK